MGEGERSGEGETNEITATVNVPALASQNEPLIVLSSSFEVPAPSPVKKKKFRRRTFLMGLTKEPVIRKERTEKLKVHFFVNYFYILSAQYLLLPVSIEK